MINGKKYFARLIETRKRINYRTAITEYVEKAHIKNVL